MMRVLALALMVCGVALGQRDEAPVRAAVGQYLDAVRAGDAAAARAAGRAHALRFSTGGARLEGYLTRGERRRVSYFVRQVEFLGAGAALVVGLWRDTEPGAKFAAGTFTLGMVEEGGAWKVATVYETLNQPLPEVSASGAPVKKDGEWEVLFDGADAGQLVTLAGGRALEAGWRVADGSLIAVPGRGSADLRSVAKYRCFEMTWEWMAAKGSNSGVKYRLYGADTVGFGEARFAAGWEYQMADDEGDGGAMVDDRQKSGALYGVVLAARAGRPAGQWNRSRLVVMEDHVEHWLNGVMTARYGVDFGFESPVLVQHHASEVRFRDLRIRRLSGR